MEKLPPQAAIFLSAEFFFVLFRSKDILVWVKHSTQRTALEQKQVDNGLGRSILLEMILFVPVSALLMLMISPLFHSIKARVANDFAFYALLGIASYGFPFAAIRQLVTRMALKTLQEFANIVHESASEQESSEPENPPAESEES